MSHRDHIQIAVGWSQLVARRYTPWLRHLDAITISMNSCIAPSHQQMAAFVNTAHIKHIVSWYIVDQSSSNTSKSDRKPCGSPQLRRELRAVRKVGPTLLCTDITASPMHVHAEIRETTRVLQNRSRIQSPVCSLHRAVSATCWVEPEQTSGKYDYLSQDTELPC
jgi:hypothetical protein